MANPAPSPKKREENRTIWVGLYAAGVMLGAAVCLLDLVVGPTVKIIKGITD